MVAEWLVAAGTLSLALATFALILVTRRSVDTAAEQITIERQRLEAAQWPRVFPAPPADWAGFSDLNLGQASSYSLPVTNGGSGTALNVGGQLEFRDAGDRPESVSLLPTSIPPGESASLRLKWTSSIAPPWTRHVTGFLHYEDIFGGRWKSAFSVYVENGQRLVHVRETEMVHRPDGTTLIPPESFTPAAWYTPTSRGEPREVRRGWAWLERFRAPLARILARRLPQRRG